MSDLEKSNKIANDMVEVLERAGRFDAPVEQISITSDDTVSRRLTTSMGFQPHVNRAAV